MHTNHNHVFGGGHYVWTVTLVRMTKAGKVAGRTTETVGTARPVHHSAQRVAALLVERDYKPSTRGVWSVEKVDYSGPRVVVWS